MVVWIRVERNEYSGPRSKWVPRTERSVSLGSCRYLAGRHGGEGRVVMLPALPVSVAVTDALGALPINVLLSARAAGSARGAREGT